MSDLYIQRSNYYLSLSEQRIIIKNDNKEIVKEVSISLLDNVLLFGNAQLTTQLIKALSKNKVNVYYFSNVGQLFLLLNHTGRMNFKSKSCKPGLILKRISV